MKKIYKKKELNIDKETADLITEKYNIDYPISEILSSRGINQNNAEIFFNENALLRSPFLMHGMQEAVEVINDVIESDSKILIYGDYDADGISAAAILKLFFDKINIESRVCLPNREEGYGLHFSLIEKQLEQFHADLLITVDCGIGNKEEIENIINSFGVEVIVTDHHELPQQLPECICINPKIDYPFAYLSGSGVALKLVQALSNDDAAMEFCTLAAIGTIADIMPITDENRIIVRNGLKKCSHKSFRAMIDSLKISFPMTVYDFSMKICPRINAAGRIGSPDVALDLLLGSKEIDYDSINKLMQANELRKDYLNEIIQEADLQIDSNSISNNKCIFVMGEEWRQGLLGIVASRYKEKYKVPVFAMRKKGDIIIGSVRSTENIDILSCMNNISYIFNTFGGHKTSAGFTLSLNNYDVFKSEMVKQMQIFGNVDFSISFDLEYISDCIKPHFIESMQKMEPQHISDKLIFHAEGYATDITRFGIKPDFHIALHMDNGLYLKGFFSFGKYYDILLNGCNFETIFTLEYDKYEKQYIGIIKDIYPLSSLHYDDCYLLNYSLSYGKNKAKVIEDTELKNLLKKEDIRIIFLTEKSMINFIEENQNQYDEFVLSYFWGRENVKKQIIIAPENIEYYKNNNNVVWIFDNKSMMENFALTENDNCYILHTNDDNIFNGSINRGECMKIYRILRAYTGNCYSFNELYDNLSLYDITKGQFYAAIRIFEELHLIEMHDNPFSYKFIQGKQCSLEDSALYNLLNRRQ